MESKLYEECHEGGGFMAQQAMLKQFREFILKEVRYSSLTKLFPAEADELFAAAEERKDKHLRWLRAW